jgi:hypothetical protein
MIQITLTSEQVFQISQAQGPVALVDAGGRRVGRALPEPGDVHDFSAEMAAWDRTADEDFKSFVEGTEKGE